MKNEPHFGRNHINVQQISFEYYEKSIPLLDVRKTLNKYLYSIMKNEPHAGRIQASV